MVESATSVPWPTARTWHEQIMNNESSKRFKNVKLVVSDIGGRVGRGRVHACPMNGVPGWS